MERIIVLSIVFTTFAFFIALISLYITAFVVSFSGIIPAKESSDIDFTHEQLERLYALETRIEHINSVYGK